MHTAFGRPQHTILAWVLTQISVGPTRKKFNLVREVDVCHPSKNLRHRLLPKDDFCMIPSAIIIPFQESGSYSWYGGVSSQSYTKIYKSRGKLQGEVKSSFDLG